MDRLFEGLLQHEIILSILGMVLFLVLLFLLVYMIVTSKEVKKILAFFIIPIIMIGFPGIKKFQFKGFIVDLEESMNQSANANPTPEEVAQVADKISKINPNRISSLDNNITMANAYAYIGDTLNAYKSTKVALEVQPSSTEASNLQAKYAENSLVKIDQKVESLQQNPSNQTLKQELNQALQEVKTESLENPIDYLTVARANEAVGRTKEASNFTDSALILNPKFKEAQEFRKSLKER